MLTSMFHTSSVIRLFCIHMGLCLFVTHLQLIPSLEFDQRTVFVLFSVRGFLAECIFHSLLPVFHAEKPLIKAAAWRSKLKTHNYPSQRSGDSDPVTAEDKHVNQTMKEAAHLWSPPISWRGCDSKIGRLQVQSLGRTHAFNGCIYWPHWALLCVLSGLCVCFAWPDWASTLFFLFQKTSIMHFQNARIILQNNNVIVCES